MSAEHQTHDPDWRNLAKHIFSEAPFIKTIGAQLDDLGPGWIESSFPVRPELMQQDDFVHAGALGTLADHSAGASAGTLLSPGKIVLTVEYKLNLLRPAQGERIRCRAEVLRAGSAITVSESEVFAIRGDEETLVAKATVTLASVTLKER